jgi:hypothetical protein
MMSKTIVIDEMEIVFEGDKTVLQIEKRRIHPSLCHHPKLHRTPITNLRGGSGRHANPKQLQPGAGDGMKTIPIPLSFRDQDGGQPALSEREP